jgi:hypothetical protein
MFNLEARAKGRQKQRELAKRSYSDISDFISQLRSNDPNISLHEIAEKLNKNGFKTRKDKTFTAMQVKRILDRGGNGSSSLSLLQDVTPHQQLNELRNLLEKEQDKVGRTYLGIAALKQENQELKTRLEQAQIEIRGLIDERDKQRDIINQERERLLVEVEQLRLYFSKKVTQKIKKAKKPKKVTPF